MHDISQTRMTHNVRTASTSASTRDGCQGGREPYGGSNNDEPSPESKLGILPKTNTQVLSAIENYPG
jgi:hypothetical protein